MPDLAAHAGLPAVRHRHPLPDGADKLSVFQCFHDHGILNYAVYQPADRCWLFQGIEVAIFGVVAALLLGLIIRWVRPRLS